ncbi:hypothetical protein SELMODRAFT_122698 [Selaginella moellendorffii]|uniref:ferredoxin--NADP(+) reductase n=1 Tax=Selaginella moellendorffii TaxID=88036 RepID=D8SQL9_SELML|nr:ferredoxin--NADP reductase, embryo isozyme, chloroplastic [Selaginella moellendorffii]EFJ13287.1 hypothetical protein SELMODRAFT_122698 [Selaginella moellendorffii]|eukprot:XP_002985709.1 ferredoxin--NADP reductase, embryo isozyme, chloroplastic [Selaginella moellendorffii]
MSRLLKLLERGNKPPFHLYTSQLPYTATVSSIQRLTRDGQVSHIVIDHGGNVPFWEGQSYGILPPGENSKRPGTRHPYHLYSIASSRYGDDLSGRSASLCVKRAIYVDPQTGEEDPSKKGVCSNFLCDCKPGDKVDLVGPFGKLMLLNESNPSDSHIMVATGTGVAPFRGFLQRLLEDKMRPRKFEGSAWLFMGAPTAGRLLYNEEFERYARDLPWSFRYDTALSRESCNKRGGRFYVQDRMEEHGEEIFKLLDGGSHIYFCGRKDMLVGVEAVFEEVARRMGEDWRGKLAKLKKNRQWHVEVY